MNEITEYNEFRSQKAEVTELCNFVPDAETEDGYDHAKSVVKQARAFYNKLEKVRKAIKAPALERCKLIDSEAKIIKDEIEEAYKPHQLAVQKKDDEEAERQREDAKRWCAMIDQKLIDIEILAPERGITLDQLEENKAKLEAVDIDSSYAHQEKASIDAKSRILGQIDNEINALKEAAAEKERLADEAEKLAKEREEMEAERKKRDAEQAEIDKKNEAIAAEQKAAEDARIAEEKRQREEKEREEAKRIADEKAEELKRQQAPDAEKLLAYAKAVDQIQLPTMQSDAGKSRMEDVNRHLRSLLAACVID